MDERPAQLNMSQDPAADLIVGNEREVSCGRRRKAVEGRRRIGRWNLLPRDQRRENPLKLHDRGQDPAGRFTGRLPSGLSSVMPPLSTGRGDDKESSHDSPDDRAAEADERLFDLLGGHDVLSSAETAGGVVSPKTAFSNNSGRS